MKKIVLITLVLLLVLVVLIAYIRQDEALTPLAAQALNYQPAPVPTEQNAYVGLVGLTAPAGSDFFQAGEALVRQFNIEPTTQQAFIVQDYPYSCTRVLTENCLHEIQADAPNIRHLLQEHHELIQRYLKIQDMPVFSNNYIPLTAISPLPLSYVDASHISRLLSAKAILDIKNGDVAQGLSEIEKDMAFYRKILAAKEAIILEKMFALAHLRRYAILLSLLIREGELNGQDEIVRSLLVPLDSPRESFKNAMWRNEVEQVRSMSHMMLNTSPNKLFERISLDDGQPAKQDYSEKLLAYFRYYFMYQHNMTANLQMELWRHEMEIIDATPLARLPSENIRQQVLERAGCTDVAPVFCNHFGNYVGEVLALITPPDSVLYLFRIYDADAHLRLVRTQLEYRLAAKQANADPTKILASLPPETFNPYTGKPFDFDAERGVIGFQPAGHNDKRVEIHLSLH